MKHPLTVVATGSVAAIKTARLAEALARQGFDLSFVITPSARGFVKAKGKYQAAAKELSFIARQTIVPKKIKTGPILIAPATAEIIKQLAHNEKLGKILNKRAKPLLIAPAMNFMMWQHPAVQKNILALKKRGVIFLGPVMGDMACGDHGYGRMAEPKIIAAATACVLSGKPHALSRAFSKSIPKNPSLPPFSIGQKILFFADDKKLSGPLARRLQKQGYELKIITRSFHHYQTDPQGMEHIRLPEQADCVVFAGLKKDLAREFAQGGASSFAACLYLASKRPVVIIPSPLNLKKILILGGDVHERVDSFRFYANNARPQDHGRKTALALRRKGFSVTLIESSGSATELIAECRNLSGTQFDTVLQLANIPQITCPSPAGHKISKTGKERDSLFHIKGNIDIKAELYALFPLAQISGFDTRQKWFGQKSIRQLIPLPKKIKKPSIKNSMGQIVITTGRTQERLTKDGVIITNGFTGQQGQEIAKALAGYGYTITLISGPTHLPDIKNKRIQTRHITTMPQMERAVLKSLNQKPLAFISVAAIADFGMAKPLTLDLAPDENFILPLIENPSIVRQVSKHEKRPPVVVSFAAQSPDKILDYASQKFKKLGVEMTVANPIGKGLDPARNKIHLITKDGIESFPEMTKAMTAKIITARVVMMISKAKALAPAVF